MEKFILKLIKDFFNFLFILNSKKEENIINNESIYLDQNIKSSFENKNYSNEDVKKILEKEEKYNEEIEEIEEIEKELKKYKYKLKNVLTDTENIFFKKLKEFLKDDQEINIFTKIRLADLITMDNYENWGERIGLFRKISQKHIDFIITDVNWQIKCLIELDDKTHEKKKAKENDKFKDEVFENLGIPL